MFNVTPAPLKNANPQIDNLREQSFKGHRLFQHVNTYYIEAALYGAQEDTLYLGQEALDTVLSGEDSGYPIYVYACFDDGSTFWGTPSEFKEKAVKRDNILLLTRQDCSELLPWEQDDIAKKGATQSSKGAPGKFSEKLFTYLEQCSEPVDASEIAAALERPVNQITTRLKVLSEQGQIIRHKNDSGRFVYSRS